MKTRLLTAALLASMFCSAGHAQTCDVQSFVSDLNQGWRTTNYPAIRASITNRLAVCTNDLMGLAMNFCYYYWVEVDFTNLQLAAKAFVAAVSNRAPDEVNQPGVVMDKVKSFAEMPPPSTFPTNQARTAEQVEYLHTKAYPTNFPRINLYIDLVTRVGAAP